MFALTFYTYLVAQLYSFLFLSCLLVMYRRYFLRERRVLMTGLIVYFILSAPYIWVIVTSPMFFRKASMIFTFANGVNSETLSVFGTNYITHFGPDFLFIHGDPNLRHGAGTGVIYWVMLPFLAAGIVYSAMADRRRNVFYFILFWLAAFPLAAALTDDGVPHAMRSLAGVPGHLPAEREGGVGARPDRRREGRAHLCFIYTLRCRRDHISGPDPRFFENVLRRLSDDVRPGLGVRT